MSDQDEFEQRAQAALRDLTAGLPVEYQARCDALGRLWRVVRQHLAEYLEPALNEALRHHGLATRRDRFAIVSLVEGLNDQFDLCVLCPQTGRPAILRPVPERPRHWGQARLAYFVQDGAGGFRQSAVCEELPAIRLAAAPGWFRMAVHEHCASTGQGRAR